MTIIDRAISHTIIIANLKRIIITVLLLLNGGISAYSQTELPNRNPYIYTKNSFALSLGSGFNRTQFYVENGEDKPRQGLGLIPRLNFDYRFSLGDHLGVSIGTGFGFSPFVYKVDEKEDFLGTNGWAYWDVVTYAVFGDIKAGVDYNKWLNERLGLKMGLGGGVIRTGDFGVTIGSQSPVGSEYFFQYEYEKGFKPYLYVSTQVDRVLKNDNIFGLSMSYEYFFGSIYEGEYSLYNNQSNGTLVNRGNNISLSLVYTFTRANKFKLAEQIFVNDENRTFKGAKQIFKKERRYIDPKSTFFGLSSGLFFARNQVGLGEHILNSGGSSSWIITANVEKGIRNNHFWQGGLSVSETWSYIRLNRPSVYWASASNEFVAMQASVGLGTRLISKKSNINFLNISAGLSLGVHTSQKGPNGNSGGSSNDGNETLYEYLITYTTKRKIYPTLYLNLSRDFQLTKLLYLSIDYRFNLGVMDVVEGQVQFKEQPDLSQVINDQISIKGTSNAFQLGIKYKLPSKSK